MVQCSVLRPASQRDALNLARPFGVCVRTASGSDEGNFEETFYDVNLQHPGWRIQSIQGNFHQTYQTVLNGYGPKTISPFGTSDFVNRMVLVGDSDGGTFGGDDKPRIVNLGFNKIELKLVN